ncbi:YegP family protein [Weissella confusa]|uniref:YegP family protein n=1 Tax=Weissella confusa TaxID=1583 RepID=UPI0018F25924|nr:YegP family protein [Weissella confusa]MBJ7629837.1 YegP family protein [Weissella confusa]
MYFVIRKSVNNQYYFTITGANNEVVATSETYFTKWSAEQTIKSIKHGVNQNSLVIDRTYE